VAEGFVDADQARWPMPAAALEGARAILVERSPKTPT